MKGNDVNATNHDSKANLSFDGRTYCVEIVDLTPDVASKLMALNVANRAISKANVDKIAAAISRGEWIFNGETIVLDSRNHMRQGQHRCLAVIKTGITIQCLIVRGVSPAAFSTFDSGRPRNASDTLGIGSEVNTRTLAAAARAIVYMEDGTYAARMITNKEIQEVVNHHPMVRTWTNRLVGNRPTRTIGAAFAGVLTLASERHGAEIIQLFFDQVASGEMLKKGDPAKVLRERFPEGRRIERLTFEVSLAFMIKAVNAFVQGKQLGILRFTAKEEFPKLV